MAFDKADARKRAVTVVSAYPHGLWDDTALFVAETSSGARINVLVGHVLAGEIADLLDRGLRPPLFSPEFVEVAR